MSAKSAVFGFFSSQGRATRRQFRVELAWVGIALAVCLTIAVLFGDNGVYDEPDVSRPLRLFVFGLATVPMVIMGLRFRGICKRRRRDCRMSGRLHAVRWVPYVGSYTHLLALGFLPSREDPMEEAIKVFDGPSAEEGGVRAVATRNASADRAANGVPSHHARREPTF